MCMVVRARGIPKAQQSLGMSPELAQLTVRAGWGRVRRALGLDALSALALFAVMREKASTCGCADVLLP